MPGTRVVLVTGASSGFGQAIAERLSAAGHLVYGTSRNPARRAPVSFRLLPLDVDDGDSVAACVRALLANAGRIDVLVNNVGAGLASAIAHTPIDAAQALMNTNFWGAARMIQAVLPGMLALKQGRIVNIGSMAGHVGLPFQAYYSASKFALEGFGEALRLELQGTGVQSTVVCPGDFATGFTSARQVLMDTDDAALNQRMRRVLAIYERDEAHGGPPAQVAELVHRILESRRLKVRYMVGVPEQRLAVLMKRWMPASWFESLMRKNYLR